MEKITFPLLDKKFATSYGNQNPSAHISKFMSSPGKHASPTRSQLSPLKPGGQIHM